MMDDWRRRLIAEECRRHILRHPDLGMTSSHLATWSVAYRRLDRDDREWVQIVLVKMPELAVIIGRCGAANFYARGHAPEGAFSMAEQQAEAIARAMRYA